MQQNDHRQSNTISIERIAIKKEQGSKTLYRTIKQRGQSKKKYRTNTTLKSAKKRTGRHRKTEGRMDDE